MINRKFYQYTLVLICLFLTSGLRLAAEPVILSEPPDGSRISTEILVEGDLPRPIYITGAGDGTNRLFLVLQPGYIRVIENGVLLDEPFLDLTGKVSVLIDQYSEQGLIGLAFHPDYENNGRFFVNYTVEPTDGLQIEEYHVSADNPNVADPASGRKIMYTDNGSEDHNGGQLAFGLDGYLYISMGDGIAFDLNHTAQDLNSLHGKILRINVNDETRPYRLIRENPYVGQGRAEIFAYGLRNPYSFSIDPVSGDMYIADVGQDTWEEINFIAGDDTDGANFGWSHYEGNSIYNRDVPAKEDMEPPALTYEHSVMRCAIISGHVYHGSLFPEFEGVYLFSDWCGSDLMALHKNEAGEWQSEELAFFDGLVGVTSVGVDDAGELYLTYYVLQTGIGGVLKIVPDDTEDTSEPAADATAEATTEADS